MPELSINADGELLYKNQKWDCMSGAERLKVATAICMEAKPSCGFVLIDGLEAMDEKTLDDFGTYLAEKNHCRQKRTRFNHSGRRAHSQ